MRRRARTSYTRLRSSGRACAAAAGRRTPTARAARRGRAAAAARRRRRPRRRRRRRRPSRRRGARRAVRPPRAGTPRARRPRSSPGRPCRASRPGWRRRGRRCRRSPRCRRSSAPTPRRPRDQPRQPAPGGEGRQSSARRDGTSVSPGRPPPPSANQHDRQPLPRTTSRNRSVLRVPGERPACRRGRCSRRTAPRTGRRRPSRSPVTMPSAGVCSTSSASLRRARCAATTRPPCSVNEPASTRSATFSRAVRRPRACAFATAAGRGVVGEQRAGGRSTSARSGRTRVGVDRRRSLRRLAADAGRLEPHQHGARLDGAGPTTASTRDDRAAGAARRRRAPSSSPRARRAPARRRTCVARRRLRPRRPCRPSGAASVRRRGSVADGDQRGRQQRVDGLGGAAGADVRVLQQRRRAAPRSSRSPGVRSSARARRARSSRPQVGGAADDDLGEQRVEARVGRPAGGAPRCRPARPARTGGSSAVSVPVGGQRRPSGPEALGQHPQLDGGAAGRAGRSARGRRGSRRAATCSSAATRSTPSTCSVTVCSTCSRGLTSRNQCSSPRHQELDGARARGSRRAAAGTASSASRARSASGRSGAGATSTSFCRRRCRLQSRSPSATTAAPSPSTCTSTWRAPVSSRSTCDPRRTRGLARGSGRRPRRGPRRRSTTRSPRPPPPPAALTTTRTAGEQRGGLRDRSPPARAPGRRASGRGRGPRPCRRTARRASGDGPDRTSPACASRLGEVGALGQEAVAGVDVACSRSRARPATRAAHVEVGGRAVAGQGVDGRRRVRAWAVSLPAVTATAGRPRSAAARRTRTATSPRLATSRAAAATSRATWPDRDAARHRAAR